MQAFADYPNWKKSESALRELRKKVTFAIFAELDDLHQVAAMVDELFTLLDFFVFFESLRRGEADFANGHFRTGNLVLESNSQLGHIAIQHPIAKFAFSEVFQSSSELDLAANGFIANL